MQEIIIPFAKQFPIQMKSKGRYATPNGMPKGLIAHHTASRDGTKDPETWGTNVVKHGISEGFTYLYIDRNGDLWQAAPINSWGNHAGKSKWPGMAGGVSDECIGVEIAGYGKLSKGADGKFYSCYGDLVPDDEVRYFSGAPGQVPGYYHKFTEAQEAMLLRLAIWFKNNDPDNFQLAYVLGHDEVAFPFGRKNDPGGSLSCSMTEFRVMLKRKWLAGAAKNEQKV